MEEKLATIKYNQITPSHILCRMCVNYDSKEIKAIWHVIFPDVGEGEGETFLCDNHANELIAEAVPHNTNS